MSKLKSNPYVYPYVPFKKLEQAFLRIENDNFIKNGKIINLRDIAGILNKIKMPTIKVKGKTVEEKIFSHFLDDNVLFGPREYIEDNRAFWLEKINYFVSRNKKIRFTLLGFPFKMPVPFKTNRTLPDMGEVLILLQLNHLAEQMKKVYLPGVEIVVFTEGGLGKFVGVSDQEGEAYKDFLIFLNKKLGFYKNIKIMDLADMEKEAEFENKFQINLKKMKTDLTKKEAGFMEKFEGAKPSLLRIINTRKYSERDLAQVYDEKISDDKVSPAILKIRQMIRKKVEQSLTGYFAYLKTRDDLNYLEKKVPHFLALSVSPKPKRLGIIPVNTWSDKLPYHSVPLYILKNKHFMMEYLVDLKYGNYICEACYLQEDKEKKPFYYIVS